MAHRRGADGCFSVRLAQRLRSVCSVQVVRRRNKPIIAFLLPRVVLPLVEKLTRWLHDGVPTAAALLRSLTS